MREILTIHEHIFQLSMPSGQSPDQNISSPRITRFLPRARKTDIDSHGIMLPGQGRELDIPTSYFS